MIETNPEGKPDGGAKKGAKKAATTPKKTPAAASVAAADDWNDLPISKSVKKPQPEQQPMASSSDFLSSASAFTPATSSSSSRTAASDLGKPRSTELWVDKYKPTKLSEIVGKPLCSFRCLLFPMVAYVLWNPRLGLITSCLRPLPPPIENCRQSESREADRGVPQELGSGHPRGRCQARRCGQAGDPREWSAGYRQNHGVHPHSQVRSSQLAPLLLCNRFMLLTSGPRSCSARLTKARDANWTGEIVANCFWKSDLVNSA